MLGSSDFLFSIAAYAGTALFAATGVLASAQRRMDWIGAIVLAIATAIGGGTLRDLLVGQLPVFWVRDQVYLWIAAGTAVLLVPLLPRISFPSQALLLPDAAGLALFTWMGCEKGHMLGLPGIIVVLLGVITSTAGGLIRDVLSAQVPNIMRQGELYAAAAVPGAIAYVALQYIHFDARATAAVCIGCAFGIRLAAIRWGLKLPEIKASQS
jgi:uncharacterized membrane protein YeiH